MDGTPLKIIRQYSRSRVQDFSSKLGLSIGAISGVENGKLVSINMLEAYASFLNVPMSALIGFMEACKDTDNPDFIDSLHPTMMPIFEWYRESMRFQKEA